MTREENIVKAQEAFGSLIREDYKRIDNMKQAQEPIDFEKLDKVTVGILPGDGIGPVIMPLALDVMEALVGDEIKSGKIEIRHIESMTIENRVAKLNSLPDECMEEIKKCQVLLKGPMVTPRAGDGLPNLVSANSLLRRGLDLYAAVRPIDVPEKNIHWTFFRENIEGEYIWGNKGIQVKVTGKTGSWYAVSYNGLSGYMSADYVKLSPGNAVADKIVATAKQYLGTPYVYGGSS